MYSETESNVRCTESLSEAWARALAGMPTVHSEGMAELCDFVRGRSPRLRGHSKPLCGQQHRGVKGGNNRLLMSLEK